MEVGFIGLGRMGGAMARNIAKAGHSVRAWNRSRRAIEGVEMVASPGDAFQADVVFTMLADDSAVREVVLSSNALDSARSGVVHVGSTSISVDFADELRISHAEAGVGYVSAPVFGRPDVAESGQLAVVAAGASAAVAKVRPMLDVVGRKTWVLGEDPKQANAAKLAGNMMIAMAIEAIAEAVALTGGYGVEPRSFLDLMLQTLFGCRVYETYGAKMIKGDFEPGFRMQLGLKDLRLATAAAEKSRQRLPLLDAVRTRMTEALDAGMGEKDWSAIADYTLHHRG
jgi:3-hydroxyisobutyrate dehydrogenase-like beta-hydroxyacid dehydrogenase